MKLNLFFKQAAFLFLMMFALQGAWAANADAQKLIQDTIDQVLAAIKENPDNAADVAKQYVLPNFDFLAMSRLVVGKNWKSATAGQKKSFVQAFRDLLIRTYANTLTEAAASEVGKVEIEYLPIRDKEGAKRVTVQTKVKYQGKSIKLDYALRNKKGNWKVWNVTAGGVSLVTNYRAEFQKIHKEKGMDGLIEAVNKKNKGE
ncbi:ABC transporter substrate-binding protein [Candidatus Albibeggiatoa sp. nov. BB20]|uniref:MlaC/ttg2D family ABC transporter substrate-binding protein n=1 Tax=Candidatus Albibeggiatoa sp. nov. BB20 TaxID=3162723 RepID=UPI00336561B9